MDEEKKIKEILINAGTVIGSTYSQVARVTVTNDTLTIEFAYVHPADSTQGQSVARVTMPLKAGIDLAQTILQTEKMHEKMKGGKKDD